MIKFGVVSQLPVVAHHAHLTGEPLFALTLELYPIDFVEAEAQRR